MRRTISLIVPLSVLLLLGAGCGQRAAENAAERQMNAQAGDQGQYRVQDGTVNYESEQGDRVNYGQNAQIPADFPQDIPRYAGGKVTSAAVLADGSASMTLTTTDAMDVALAWYDAQLTGWKKTADLNYGGQTTRQYTKGGFSIGLVVAPQGTGSMITIARTKQ